MNKDQVRILDDYAKLVLQEALPLEGERAEKEQFLQELEKQCRELVPTAKLMPFGSYVSGFATRGSDIDCVFTTGNDDSEDPSDSKGNNVPGHFPEILTKKLQEAGYEAQLLLKTRVPIIKLVRKPTENHPTELQCDIGFSNYLAVHNTNLLKAYAGCDDRLTQMVQFVKVC